LVRKLQDSEINKYVSRNSPFSGIWENIIHQEGDDLPGETKTLMAEYLLPKLKKLFTEAEGTPVFVLINGKSFKTGNLQRVEVSNKYIVPQFNVSMNSENIAIE